MKSEDKAKLLLSEYASLRSEIVARTGHTYQVGALGLTAMTISISLLASSGFPWTISASIAGAIIFGIAAAAWFIWRDVEKLARRVKEIEQQVNRIAGEHLLVWEQLSGSATTGFWGPSRQLPRSVLPKLSSSLRRKKNRKQ